MIVNTCGWDTDCNSGNVGCLLGIKNGLAGDRRRARLARPGGRPALSADRRRRPRHHRRRDRDATTSSTSAGRWPASARGARKAGRASTSTCRARCRASELTALPARGRRSRSTMRGSRAWTSGAAWRCATGTWRPAQRRASTGHLHPAGGDRATELQPAGLPHPLSGPGGDCPANRRRDQWRAGQLPALCGGL